MTIAKIAYCPLYKSGSMVNLFRIVSANLWSFQWFYKRELVCISLTKAVKVLKKDGDYYETYDKAYVKGWSTWLAKLSIIPADQLR
ncbi:hypothetical protein GCM10023150_21080 [Kangiella taiwanensis]|uniref:Uncharacterized protein n=1 Tax=Kangiella taiwanensis TaxID=1079179 RepID=A0ABP8I7S6_9GAMM